MAHGFFYELFYYDYFFLLAGTTTKGESHTVAAIMCVGGDFGVELGLSWVFWNWAGPSPRVLGNGDWDSVACLLLSGCQNKVKNQMFLISTLTAS